MAEILSRISCCIRVVRSGSGSAAQPPIAGAALTLRNNASNAIAQASANGEGVFRVFPLIPGNYSLIVHADGFADFSLERLTVRANEVLTLEIILVPVLSSELRSRLPRLPELGPPLAAGPDSSTGSYREFRHRLDSDPNYILNPAHSDFERFTVFDVPDDIDMRLTDVLRMPR